MSIGVNNFKLAEHEFSTSINNIEVKDTIARFRELVNRGRIVGVERDINYWRCNKDYASFLYYVNRIYTDKSKRELKKLAKSNSIRIVENELAFAVIPLTYEASCYYGYNTKWCISTSKSHSLFDGYFNADTTRTLVFFIVKGSTEKFATPYNPKRLDKEYYNTLDKRVEYDVIERATNISLSELDAGYELARIAINKARLVNSFKTLREDNKVPE